MHNWNRTNRHRVDGLGRRSKLRFGLSVTTKMPSKVVGLSFLTWQPVRLNVDLSKIVRMTRPFFQCQDHFSRILQHGSFQLFLLPTNNRLVVDLHHFITYFYFPALMGWTLKFNSSNNMNAFIRCLNKHALQE